MRTLSSSIDRAVIDAGIRAARYPNHDPARWALPLLDLIDRGAARWSLVALDSAEFGALWLPHHGGEPCHGDTQRLGDGRDGAALQDAASWLDRKLDEYAGGNPSCWGRLVHAAGQVSGPLVIATVTVGDRVKPDHARHVVVDGLHRALAWWRRGDRTCLAYLARD